LQPDKTSVTGRRLGGRCVILESGLPLVASGKSGLTATNRSLPDVWEGWAGKNGLVDSAEANFDSVWTNG
ncbi:MAG: hypothetical protein KDA85_21080, partial [Planctomycetaceae bacterium]|nr:hypothetical protein [Planctomycetaceae bacterium]